MRWILFLLAILVFVDGFLKISTCQTIMQQLAAIMTIALAGTLFTGAAIVDAVVNLKKEITKQNKAEK